MAGSKGGGTVVQQPSSTTQQTIMPPEVQKLFNFVTPQLEETLAARPLKGFAEAAPQEIAGLTPEQQQALAFFSARQDAPVLNAPESTATANLTATASSVPGQSPGAEAIRAYLQHRYETETLPAIQNEMALAGQGNSGAYGETIRRARADMEGAMVPVLQSDQARIDAANRDLFGVGSLIEGREKGRATEGFEMGELARQIEQAESNAAYADYLRIQDLITSITGSVTGTLLPASLTKSTQGGPLKQKSTDSNTKMTLPFGIAGQFS